MCVDVRSIATAATGGAYPVIAVLWLRCSSADGPNVRRDFQEFRIIDTTWMTDHHRVRDPSPDDSHDHCQAAVTIAPFVRPQGWGDRGSLEVGAVTGEAGSFPVKHVAPRFDQLQPDGDAVSKRLAGVGRLLSPECRRVKRHGEHRNRRDAACAQEEWNRRAIR